MTVVAAALMLVPLLIGAGVAAADSPPAFHAGPVFPGYGKIATVDSDLPVPRDTVLKVAFDVSDQAKPGEVNRGLDTVARFINMHVAAGVPEANIHVGVVVHGKAGIDLLDAAAYGARIPGAINANAPLIRQLLDHRVRIYLCGQSAAGMGIAKRDVLPGVQMALSAMTAFALLQQQGYSVDPF